MSRWINFKKLFFKLDFAGPEYYFESNDSSRFQSVAGLIFSILGIATCLSIGFMFGQEIYKRKSPNVSISQEFVQYSDVLMKEFPIMLSFITTNGTSLSAQNFNNYFDPYIFFITMDDLGNVQKADKYYDFESCDPSHYTKYSDLVTKKIASKPNTNYLCMKHDIDSAFRNSYYSLNSTNLNFKIKKCNVNMKDNICSEDINDVIHDMLITITYVTSFVDFYDFSDPVITYMDELTTQANLYLTRRSYLRFVYNAFESDNGMLLEEKNRQEFIYLNSIVPDDLLLNYQGPDTDVLYWLALESPKLRNLTARNYMKVQDLLAKIGGLANAIIVICRIIPYHYLRYMYLFSLKECALDAIYQNELEQSIINNLNNSKLKNINFEVSNFKIKEIVNMEEESAIKSNKNSGDNSKLPSNVSSKRESPKDVNIVSNNVKNIIGLEHRNNNVISKNADNDNSVKYLKVCDDSNDAASIKRLNLKENDNLKNNENNNTNKQAKISNTDFNNNNKHVSQNNTNKDILDIFKNMKSKITKTTQNKTNKTDIKDNFSKNNNTNKLTLFNNNTNINNTNNANNNFNNANNVNINSNKNANNNKLYKKDSLPEKELDALKSINTKKSFFSPSVVLKLLINKKDLSYCEYLKSIMCCNRKTYSKYEIQIKAVRKILSIHTYSKLVISQYNPTSENSALLEQEI